MQPFRASPLGGGGGGANYYFPPSHKTTTTYARPVTTVVTTTSTGGQSATPMNYYGGGQLQAAAYQGTQQRTTVAYQPTGTPSHFLQGGNGSPSQTYATYAAPNAQQLLAYAYPAAAAIPSVQPPPSVDHYAQVGMKQQVRTRTAPPPVSLERQVLREGVSYAQHMQYIQPLTPTSYTPPASQINAPLEGAAANNVGAYSATQQVHSNSPGGSMMMMYPAQNLTQFSSGTPQRTVVRQGPQPSQFTQHQTSVQQPVIFQQVLPPIYSQHLLPQQITQPMLYAPPTTTGAPETLLTRPSVQQQAAAYQSGQRQQQFLHPVQEASGSPEPTETQQIIPDVDSPPPEPETSDIPAQAEQQAREKVEEGPRYAWQPPAAVTAATAAARMQLPESIIPQNSAVSRQAPIEAGDVMPPAHIDLHAVCVNLQEFFEDRSGVLFGVLGAYNPQDTKVTVPLILQNMLAFERLVDFVGCLAVNDPFVVKAWAKKLGVSDQFTFIADSDARFTEALGMGVNLPEKGLGLRCRRFAAVVGPKATFRYVAFDEEARADRVLSVLPRFVRTPWKSFLIGICYDDEIGQANKATSGATMWSSVYQSLDDMRNYLTEFGYCPESDWQLILSNCLEDVFKPTAENILSGLKWLVDGAQAGDVLCCYFNGQTVMRTDADTGEEILCIKAIDHLDGGLVPVSDIAALLLPAVPENCRLNLIVDGACFSLNLNYLNGEPRSSDNNCRGQRQSRHSSEAGEATSAGEILVLESRKAGAAQVLAKLPKFSTYRTVAQEIAANAPVASGRKDAVVNFWSSRPIRMDQELHISDCLDPSEFTATDSNADQRA